jgi:uroporphyrinogen III methyltransferase/synthase
MLGGDVEPLARALIACIGPVTARTVEEMGLVAPLVAEEHTIIGLVQALEEHFSPVSSERVRV